MALRATPVHQQRGAAERLRRVAGTLVVSERPEVIRSARAVPVGVGTAHMREYLVRVTVRVRARVR